MVAPGSGRCFSTIIYFARIARVRDSLGFPLAFLGIQPSASLSQQARSRGSDTTSAPRRNSSARRSYLLTATNVFQLRSTQIRSPFCARKPVLRPALECRPLRRDRQRRHTRRLPRWQSGAELLAPEFRPMEPGGLSDQEPFTAWLRRGLGRDRIFVEGKPYPSRGTAEAIREQSRQGFGRSRGAIERQRQLPL